MFLIMVANALQSSFLFDSLSIAASFLLHRVIAHVELTSLPSKKTLFSCANLPSCFIRLKNLSRVAVRSSIIFD